MKLAVGLFTLMLFGAVATSSYLLLKEKGVFQKHYTFYFKTLSASSFTIGMPIRYAGFRIGMIETIELNEDGTVQVAFVVNEENRKWINQDSFFLLQRPLIGSAHIEVYTTPDGEVLKDKTFVEITISDDINTMISKLEPVVNTLINIINSLDTISTKLSSDDSDLFAFLANLKTLSERLAQEPALLTSVTGDKEATQSFINTLHQLSQTAKNANSFTQTLDSSLLKPSSNAIATIQAILDDLHLKLQKLDPLVQNISGLDKEVLVLEQELQSTIKKSNQLRDKIDTLLADDESSEIILP